MISEQLGELEESMRILKEQCDELAMLLSSASSMLDVEGAPPTEKLDEEIRDLRRAFLVLQQDVVACASEIPESDCVLHDLKDNVTSLRALRQVMTHMIDQEIRRIRLAVQAVVPRVLHLYHSEQDDFGPLLQLRRSASDLLKRLEALDDEYDSDDENSGIDSYSTLLKDLQPFLALLDLITTDVLDDERWVALQNDATSAFGLSLAVAAARGKIKIISPSTTTMASTKPLFSLWGTFHIPTDRYRATWSAPGNKARQVLFVQAMHALVITQVGAALVDIATGRVQWEIIGHTDFGVLSTSGQQLALISGGTVSLWSLGREVSCRFGPFLREAYSVALAHDGHALVLGRLENEIGVWDCHTGERLLSTKHLERNDIDPEGQIPGEVYHLLSGPYGKVIAALMDSSGTLCILDAIGGELIDGYGGIKGWARSVAFSAETGVLATGTDDAVITLWHTNDHWFLEQVGHSDWIRSLSFSPDGMFLASAGDDETVRLWRTLDLTEVACLRGHRSRVRSVVFSADGQTLASVGDDNCVRLWSVTTTQQVGCLDMTSPAGPR